ncbi:MAG: hypothetical protein ABW174_09530 [Flavitalea sp.]
MDKVFKYSEPWLRLVRLLRDLENDSIWGLAIERSFAESYDMDALLAQLAEQVNESPNTMEKIIGTEAVTIIKQYLLPAVKRL